MAFIRRTVQSSIFEKFYPTTLAFSAAKKNYFLGHSKDKSYMIYNMTDAGKIEPTVVVQKGKLKTYLQNIQAFYDPTQNKQYLYGYNLDEKVIDVYQIADNASIQLMYSEEFTVEDSIKSATFFIINGVLCFYTQSDKTKSWYIYNLISY
ncbi:TPA: XRE family transcriptional regulator [Providencia alcalifaciens]|nr:XRE family transcriptional regulator [Providencia alcalifaciens]